VKEAEPIGAANSQQPTANSQQPTANSQKNMQCSFLMTSVVQHKKNVPDSVGNAVDS
jgi:hypothetical protein